MRKVLAAAILLVCAVLLTSCSLLPFGSHGVPFPDSDQKSDAQMDKLAAALNAHDAAALKAMFSARALGKAADIDTRLNGLLSLFPKGGVTWKRDASSSEGDQSYGTELLESYDKVSAGGVDYSLFFADFTLDKADADNVGLYALGVSAWSEDRGSGPSEPFFVWAGSMSIDESNANAYPGVWAPLDSSQLSVQKLNQIVSDLNTKDAAWLRGRFSDYAQLEHGAQLDDLSKLFKLFPGHDVVRQDDPQIAPVVRENTENGKKVSLLLSTHRVSAGGADYRMFFAYFTENTVNPDNVGLYAIGVAPWTDSGTSPAEQALTAWANAFTADAGTPPGILISQ